MTMEKLVAAVAPPLAIAIALVVGFATFAAYFH